MKNQKWFVLFLLGVVSFTACKKDDSLVDDGNNTDLPSPTISNVEIGLNNNEIGVIAQDFHFNADIVAGDKIDYVEAKILQRDNESYAKEWSYEKKWEQYKGAKNTNIHSHFDIPADAAEGLYDFLIIVHDENGSKLEEKRQIRIWTAENLPVNPSFSTFNVMVNGDFSATEIKSGQPLYIASRINYIKDDGTFYIVLINKKHNHKPETVDAIDFSKAIVYDMREHKDIANTSQFGNVSPLPKDLIIGATQDVLGNPISGEKAWETGTYFVAGIYSNTTHNMSAFEYKEIKVTIE